jgi:uncharacterized protein (DUF983 family)
LEQCEHDDSSMAERERGIPKARSLSKHKGAKDKKTSPSISSSLPPCGNPDCRHTHKKRIFIRAGCVAGGQDWSQYRGKKMCLNCYDRYLKRGTFAYGKALSHKLQIGGERLVSCYKKKGVKRLFHKRVPKCVPHKVGESRSPSALKGKLAANKSTPATKGIAKRKKPQAKAAHTSLRCSNADCKRASRQFLYVRHGCAAGGADWSKHAGTILCLDCYNETYEVAPRKGAGDSHAGSSCANCGRQKLTRGLFKVKEHCSAGGRDWEPYVGKSFCCSCFQLYMAHGRFKKKQVALRGDAACAKCKKASKKYRHVRHGSEADLRNGKAYVGKKLCLSCYLSLRRHVRSEEGTQSSTSKSQRRCVNPKCTSL